MTYGELRTVKLEALRSKPNQKKYRITYNMGCFTDEMTVKAASKKDAKILSGISRGITKVELIA